MAGWFVQVARRSEALDLSIFIESACLAWKLGRWRRCRRIGAAGSGARGAGRPGESGGAGEGSAMLWEGGGDGDVTRDGGDAGVGGVGEACQAGT